MSAKRKKKHSRSKKFKKLRASFFVLCGAIVFFSYLLYSGALVETPSFLNIDFPQQILNSTFDFSVVIPYVVAFIVILVFVFMMRYLIKRRKRRKKQREHMYYSVNHLLTSEEIKFFRVLSNALSNSRLVVCPKVRLGDVVCVQGVRDREWFSKFAKVSQKHLDFVLCDQKTMKIVCAIELDDPTHEWASSQKRDKEKNDACREAGFALLRYKTRRSYDAHEISGFLRRNHIRL